MWGGHDHEKVEIQAWIMPRQSLPASARGRAMGVQVHFALDDLAQKGLAIMGAEGHKVGPGQGIIVPLEPYGAPMMDLWVVGHAADLSHATTHHP